jgi:hypothetical protein
MPGPGARHKKWRRQQAIHGALPLTISPFILLQGIEKQFPKLEEDEKTRSVFQRELFLNCGKGFRLSASLLYTFFERIYQNGDTGIFNKEV